MKKILLGVIAVAIIVFVGFSVQDSGVTGSVSETNEYQNAYIDSTNASSTATTQLLTGYGSLGSVVIASSTSASYLVLHDATSTQATSTDTIIATFKTEATPGTYQFDVLFDQGLKLDIPAGFNGVYNITFR